MFKVNDLQLTKNFKLSEFACKEGSGYIVLDYNLFHKLQLLRDKIGRPVHITSGYRSPDYNKKIGGASKSQHLFGKAADIWVDGMEIKELLTYAELVGFNGIGVYKNFLHVDVRDKEARW